MKSKTLVFATLLLITAFLLMQAIAPHTALADASWTNTGGGVSGYGIGSLAYDSGHNLLYAGTESGVWEYDGTTWTDTSGGVSSYEILSLTYDSAHNLLYAGTSNRAEGGYGVWKYDGTTWTNTGGGVSSYQIGSLAYDSGHNLLYAGCSYYSPYTGMTGEGVWKYDGTTWTNTGGGVSRDSIYSLAYDSGHNLLYAGCSYYSPYTGTTGEGVWKYDGTTWTNTGGGVSSYEILTLAYNSAQNLLYAGGVDSTGAGIGVWEYDGTTWTNTGGGVSSDDSWSLDYDSAHNLLYAGTSNGVEGGYGVWEYDGTTWTNTGGGISDLVTSLAYNSAHNLLYAGTLFNGVWYCSPSAPVPPPTVSSIAPSSGSSGTTVHITDLAGTGFQAGATVKLSKSGQGDITATGVNVVSAAQITCDFNLTGAATGAWDVVVTNPDTQSGTLAGGFTVNAASAPAPTVTSISPSQGVAGWPVNVTNLAGTGFQAGATVSLEKSGVPTTNATSVTVVSDTKITCTLALPGNLGKYDVVVKNPDGQEGRLTQGFSVTNICGQGAGTIVVGFGLMMGLLYVGNRRKRFLQFPEV